MDPHAASLNRQTRARYFSNEQEASLDVVQGERGKKNSVEDAGEPEGIVQQRNRGNYIAEPWGR